MSKKYLFCDFDYVDDLEPRQQTAFRMRYGLDERNKQTKKRCTFKEIGKALHVSVERARQILCRAENDFIDFNAVFVIGPIRKIYLEDNPEEMENQDKCEMIIQGLIEFCNAEFNEQDKPVIAFAKDWGGNSLTVQIPRIGHYHIGFDDGSFENLVDDLYRLFVKKPEVKT